MSVRNSRAWCHCCLSVNGKYLQTLQMHSGVAGTVERVDGSCVLIEQLLSTELVYFAVDLEDLVGNAIQLSFLGAMILTKNGN